MNTSQHLYKIQAPTLPTPILHREALVRLLVNCIEPPDPDKEAPTKLILLCAPAGYGKTTLLVDAISQISAACCWYFWESSDTPATFLKGLLVSVQQRFPAFGKHLDALLPEPDIVGNDHPDTREHWENILDLITKTLDREVEQQFVLALCNYHKVQQNETINQLINRLLARSLRRGVLIIESRSLPNLTLAPLIAHRQMFGLGSDKLRFTAQELHQLAHLQGFTNFTLQESEHLTNSFEGWIAGILLGSSLGYTQMYPLAPSHKGNWGTLAQIADHQQLSIYMANEVFSQQAAAYEFLEAVSIFDQLTPERCNALLGITDAAERLIYAEQQGLFVMRSKTSVEKDSVGVYICHPILRELFRENLHSHSFARYLALHRKAAQLLRDDHEYEQALIHALRAQEYSLAISIIAQITPSFVTQRYSKAADLWLDMLPEQILKQDPWLLMALVNIHLTRNEYAQVPPLLDDVDTLLETAPPEQNPSASLLLRAEIKLARSKLFFYQGNFQRSQELCQEILDLLPADEVHLRIRTYHRLGVCLVVGMGYIHEGILQFQHALQLSNSRNDEQQVATLHRLLASAYGWIGSYTLANYHQERALRIWEKLHEPWGIINNLTSMGLLKLRQGLTGEAEEMLMKALHLAKEVYHFKSGEAYALVALGEICCTLAQYVRALAYLEDGLNLAKQCGDRYLVHCSLCSIATTYLFMGEIQISQFFLDQITLQKQEERTYEGLLRCLIRGRLSLAQQIYDQAQQDLEYAVALGNSTNIRFLHIQALLLLAVCYARQQKTGYALQTARKVLELNGKGDLDYTLEIESRWYSELPDLLAQAADIYQNEREDALSVGRPSFQQTSSTSEVTQKHHSDGAFQLRILAFGEPKVLVDDTPITRWHMNRSLELFFLFLESAGPLSKDKLIDALWPNVINDQIDTTMRTAIYYLRQAIGKACVIYDAGLYSLNLEAAYGPEIWYDVALFETRYGEAKKALEAFDDETSRAAFMELVTLYKGDFLQSFYNDWCIHRRNQLRLAYMDAREQLALIAWRQEYWKESMEHWHYLLSLDPCFEKAHYGLMRCYLRQGKRELALRQYQLCCQNLRDDLQTTPGPLIKKLYQRIK